MTVGDRGENTHRQDCRPVTLFIAHAIIGHFRRQGLDAIAIGRIRKGLNDVELVR